MGELEEYEVEVVGLLRDEGSILVLEGADPETGQRVAFAADRRPALAILEALNAGDHPTALVPPWAMLGRVKAWKEGA